MATNEPHDYDDDPEMGEHDPDAVQLLIAAHEVEFGFLRRVAACKREVRMQVAALRHMEQEIESLRDLIQWQKTLNPDDVNVPALQETVKLLIEQNERLQSAREEQDVTA